MRTPREPLSLLRLCSRENVQHVLRSDPGVIAIKIGILVASNVSNEMGADPLNLIVGHASWTIKVGEASFSTLTQEQRC